MSVLSFLFMYTALSGCANKRYNTHTQTHTCTMSVSEHPYLQGKYIAAVSKHSLPLSLSLETVARVDRAGPITIMSRTFYNPVHFRFGYMQSNDVQGGCSLCGPRAGGQALHSQKQQREQRL